MAPSKCGSTETRSPIGAAVALPKALPKGENLPLPEKTPVVALLTTECSDHCGAANSLDITGFRIGPGRLYITNSNMILFKSHAHLANHSEVWIRVYSGYIVFSISPRILGINQ